MIADCLVGMAGCMLRLQPAVLLGCAEHLQTTVSDRGAAVRLVAPACSCIRRIGREIDLHHGTQQHGRLSFLTSHAQTTSY